jgi:hypothetical protein
MYPSLFLVQSSRCTSCVHCLHLSTHASLRSSFWGMAKGLAAREEYKFPFYSPSSSLLHYTLPSRSTKISSTTSHVLVSKKDKETKDVSCCFAALLCMCFSGLLMMIIIHHCSEGEINEYYVLRVFAHGGGRKNLSRELAVGSTMIFNVKVGREGTRRPYSGFRPAFDCRLP